MLLNKLYYSVWTDGIKRMQERFPESNLYWKFMLMLFMVVSFGGFSMFLYGFIGRILGLPWPHLNLFQNGFLEKTLSALVFFMLPWFVIHYYLVLWKNKYQIFMSKYKYHNGKLFFNFFLCIIFTPLFIFIIGVIIAKMSAN